MDCGELSDLEEGEILECESFSPSECRNDGLEIKSRTFDSVKLKHENRNFGLNNGRGHDLYLPGQKKEGCVHKSLKDKFQFDNKLENTKSNFNTIDLESISSEGECKSDEEGTYITTENKYYTWNSKERKPKGKHSTHFYGAVEDIMSEIGETICRKSRCNYKKRKSKDSQYSLYKSKDSSYDLWRHKIFSSHLKSKKHKRKMSFSDSDSELKKERSEKRKKRTKKRELYYEKNERNTKKAQVKDFDEMRRNLLEKLKKQKAEKESKAEICEFASKVENPEMQEVDMLIDCTGYEENPPDEAIEVSDNEEWKTEEKNGEDELDLIKLRLIALASNKNKKDFKPSLKTENSEKLLEKKNFSNNSKEEVDLDRNELLLRAEALKTALLKKHQKRLNKIKITKLSEIESSSDNGVTSFLPSPMEKNLKEINLEKNVENLDGGAFKENVEKKNESGVPRISSDDSSAHILDFEMNINETAVISNSSPKKMQTKTRSKRKKRKSCSFASNLKENSEKSESLEEDDRTLRSQLLNDLMKKKSLKDLEKKSVLIDSIQTSVNQNPLSVKYNQTLKETTKPPPIVKKNLLKKINVPKKIKPMAAPPIPKSEIQRIIVHLGSEDSSDEDASTFQALSGLGSPEQESSHFQDKINESQQNSIMVSSNLNKKEDKIIQAAYEKSVEILLNQARKKIEGKKRRAIESTLALGEHLPEAVYKHLPLSQRLEYMRLKQKIAEREKLQTQKKENSVNSLLASGADPQPLDISTSTSEKESFKSISETSRHNLENLAEADPKQMDSPSSESPVSKTNSCMSNMGIVPRLPSNAKILGGLANVNELKPQETTSRLVNNEVKNNFTNICVKDLKECVPQPGCGKKTMLSAARSTLLLPFSQTLLTKLKLLLKKIKIEKMIEENYEKEISKLKNQLILFEKKKGEQRFKIKKLGEESIKTYKAIQGITAKSNEKSIPKKDDRTEKKGDGIDGKSEVKEKYFKERTLTEKGREKEEKSMKLPKEPVTEISKVDKSPSKMSKELNNDRISETIDSGKSSSFSLLEYQSPLQIFNKLPNCSEKVDPNVMMCQFDLTGVCKDEECAYQHLRAS